MRRLSDKQLKDLGFEQVDSMQAHQKDGVVVSYGLVVAVGKTSAPGYHDYSPTTAKQVTRATGTDTATRRKEWNIISERKFKKIAEKTINRM